jgi:hypothetical protein
LFCFFWTAGVDELTRIEEAGGEVIFRGNCFRVQGDLAMSRSFGDLRLKYPLNLVTADPEIRVEELSPLDQFVIIASGNKQEQAQIFICFFPLSLSHHLLLFRWIVGCVE